MSFCCEQMQNEIKELSNANTKEHSVVYDKIWRTFMVRLNEEDEKRDRNLWSSIYYCPWCGTKLATDLGNKWFDVLETEYGITDPSHTEYSKVPLEFRTDEWWKKRGLKQDYHYDEDKTESTQRINIELRKLIR